MNIHQIYDLAVKMGVENDLRGPAQVKKILARRKKKYEEMSGKAKARFDKESLINPFSDTRVFVDPRREIKKVMAGIYIFPAANFFSQIRLVGDSHESKISVVSIFFFQN